MLMDLLPSYMCPGICVLKLEHESGWVGVHLQECIAPLMEALITIFLLFRVGSACLVQPIFEQFFILLQHQVLAQYYIGLVKTLVCQAFSQDFTNPCQLSHKFLPHWLTNKVAVLL